MARGGWVPAHEGIIGNERAHTLASSATEPNNPSSPATGLKRLKSALIREGRKRIRAEWSMRFNKNPTTGIFTRKLDGALPQRHTVKLYNGLSAQESGISHPYLTSHRS